MSSDSELRERVRKRIEARVGFYIHLVIYIGINLMLFSLWWIQGADLVNPWFIYPLIIWGIFVVINFIVVFVTQGFVERKVEEEVEKIKREDKGEG